MQKLHFSYEMLIKYSIPVGRCNFTIKCIPKNTRRQRIEDVSIELFPTTKYFEGIDGFRNAQIYGVNEEPHDTFRFFIEGTAYTGLSYYEEIVNEDLAMIFRHPHGLNVAGPEIEAFYEDHRPDENQDAYQQAIDMMHILHKELSYETASTSFETTAEEAFAQRKGVCQDYAHIFISLMHLAGIPARYVTGLILGEGASHAWVEILYDGKWYGLDPTNDLIVAGEHIKIGVGRDAGDCMINRGIMHGGGLHTQEISVHVIELEE